MNGILKLFIWLLCVEFFFCSTTRFHKTYRKTIEDETPSLNSTNNTAVDNSSATSSLLKAEEARAANFVISNNEAAGDKDENVNKKNETTNAASSADDTKDSDDGKYVPGLTQQKFLQIDGYEISDLQKSSKYPDKPDEVNAITDINSVVSDEKNNGDREETVQSYGERIFGYFKPPKDGNYVFKLSSKATGQFSISQTESPNGLKSYASVKGRQIVEPNDYDKFPKQKSMPISLKSNQMYYFEVLHKVLYGENHIQLGATFPDGSDHYPMEGSYFFSMKDLGGDSGGGGIGSNGNGGGGGGGAGNGDGGGAGDGGGGDGGGDGAGDGGGGGGGNGGGGADALKAAYDAGLKAGEKNGQNAGASAGESAGKQAGGDAGARAGAQAGLKAAAEALGISIEQLQQEKANREANKKCSLKLRIYSGNFKCKKPGGHVCKHALSAQEDNSIRLNPREAATTFILRKPGLNHDVNSISLELDSKRGTYLVKDGSKFIVSAADGTKSFSSRASFLLESQDGLLPSSYGLKLFDQPDYYVCHTSGTSDVAVAKVSENCAFHIVSPELDMNSLQDTCEDYCNTDDNAGPRPPASDAPEMSPTQKRAATTETLHLLNSLAKHAVHVASEKFAERAQHEISTKMEAEHKLMHDHTYYEALHSAVQAAHDHTSHDEGHDTDIHGQEFIILHFKNKVGSTGDVRIISSIKPEGYVLGSDVFKLKIVFKYKYINTVAFHAVDESGKGREVLLNGKKELTFQPTASIFDYSDVIVSTNPTLKVTEIHGDETHGEEHTEGAHVALSEHNEGEHTSPEHPVGDHPLEHALDHPVDHSTTANEHNMDTTVDHAAHFLAHEGTTPNIHPTEYHPPSQNIVPSPIAPLNPVPAAANPSPPIGQSPPGQTMALYPTQPVVQQTAYQKGAVPIITQAVSPVYPLNTPIQPQQAPLNTYTNPAVYSQPGFPDSVAQTNQPSYNPIVRSNMLNSPSATCPTICNALCHSYCPKMCCPQFQALAASRRSDTADLGRQKSLEWNHYIQLARANSIPVKKSEITEKHKDIKH